MLETSSVAKTKGRYPIHCLTIVGQVEGHTELPQGTKATKYEHVIPLLVAIEEDPDIDGLLIILNTVGGDVEAGLAIAELIAGMKKPTASLVLGGGHSIGIPLAVSADRSFIVPTATMTVHPVRHSGMMLGVPQTMKHFDRMQERITGFICDHSEINRETFTELLMKTGELVMDVGTVLDGGQAVEIGLIDSMGSLGDAMRYLYQKIHRRKKEKR
ncbi:MAG: ATP-dependent Clp protease proteolytic subunit [Oscillospiraceae bacterium]